jgi:outer membrane protein assembly factor BamB
MAKLDNIGKIIAILVTMMTLAACTLHFMPQTSIAQSTNANISSDPEVQWYTQAGSMIKSPIVDDKYFLYLVSDISSGTTVESEGSILAISRKTGEIKYQYDIGEQGEFYEREVTFLSVYQDRVFVCSNNNGFICLNKTTFELVWTQPYNGINPPVIDQGRIFFTYSSRNLYCLDFDSGVELWSYPIGVTNCVPAVYENHVFAADYDKIYIFNAENGNLVWSNGILRTNQVEAPSSPIIHDNKMIITTSDYNLHVYGILGAGTSQLKLGNELWTLEGRRLFPHFSQPVVYQDILVICYNNKLNAHDLNSGADLWTNDLNCQNVVLSGERLIVTGDTSVYAIDPETGHNTWELDIGVEELEDGPEVKSLTSGFIITDKEAVYVTDEDAWVYKLGDSTETSDDSDIHWPLSLCINAVGIIIIVAVIYAIVKWRMKRK